MKQKINRSRAALLTGASLLAASPGVYADGIADGITAMGGFAAAVAGGAAVIVGIKAAFVAIRLGKKLLGHAG